MRDLIFLITWAAATSAFSVAERSYPTAEVRGRSRGDPMPKGTWPRGVIPRPKSGAAAKSARLRRHGNGRKELPHVQGQGWPPRGATLCPRLGRRPGGPTPSSRPGAAAERSNPTSKKLWLCGHRRA